MKPVNLVPQDQRRRTASQGDGKSAPIALGVLAALLALVVVYVLTNNSVTERKSETAAASAEADRLEARAGQQASYTDFAQIAVTRTQSVAGVAAERFDWERFMRELSRVMPEGSWISNTSASVTGEDVGTGSATADPLAVPTPKANLVGCTPRQSEVARMMVRLEQMYRVTEVTLNESIQDPAAGDTTLQDCGKLYKFDLTVSFSPVQPSNEAPKGETRVPASLGGGS
jgi:Tfp pilus assembly protein PilN